MKTYKQFINENKKVELTTEDLERMMDKNGILDIYNKGLTKLPPLPKGLKEFRCSGNNLTELPSLPKGLINLYCSNNDLTELPSLPESLEILFCYRNNLTELPQLPKGLQKLYFGNNNLVDLPLLPEVLIELSCRDNKLTKLPSLPEGLLKLYCQNNPDITKYNLPFPSSLQELMCDNLYGFTDLDEYKKWLEKQQWRKDNPDLATLDDIGLL